MPQKLPVDYSLGQMLYSQGITYKEIAKRLGAKEATVRTYGARHRWIEQSAKARQTLSEIVTNAVQRKSLTLQERAEKWVDTAARDVEKTAEELAKLPRPCDLQGFSLHESVHGAHVKRGNAVFQRADGASVTMRVGVFLGQAAEDRDLPVLDVQPEAGQLPDA